MDDILNPIIMSEMTKNTVPTYLETRVGNSNINPSVKM